MSVTLLAIESSCDDTAAAVVRDGVVLSNVVNSQVIHLRYGGVVPELASRAHQAQIVPVVDAALKEAGTDPKELNAIAFTRGPGLMGSLLVGVSFAKAMALSLSIPLVEVHHLQAHVLAQFGTLPHPDFPFLCLLVSGGHTQIILVKSHLDMEVLGSTLDDAAGEAFDKTGKMLGLDYPAGPEIDRLAALGEPSFSLPHPQLSGYDLSFSGFKTAVRQLIEKGIKEDPDFVSRRLPEICSSVRHHIVEILLAVLFRAAENTGITHLSLAGGVSANSLLRERFLALGNARNLHTYLPPVSLSTDNAAMIGIAGHYKYVAGQFADLHAKAEARIALSGKT